MNTMSICILDEFDDSYIKWYFLTDKKKFQDNFLDGRAEGYKNFQEYGHIERFGKNSNFVVNLIEEYDESGDNPFIAIEDYSFASNSSRALQIGENGGILKYNLFMEGYLYNVVSPKMVKKFATGNGNANKEEMHKHFLLTTQINLLDEFSVKKPDKPVEDLVDSYYIAKWMKDVLKNGS